MCGTDVGFHRCQELQLKLDKVMSAEGGAQQSEIRGGETRELRERVEQLGREVRAKQVSRPPVLLLRARGYREISPDAQHFEELGTGQVQDYVVSHAVRCRTSWRECGRIWSTTSRQNNSRSRR